MVNGIYGNYPGLATNYYTHPSVKNNVNTEQKPTEDIDLPKTLTCERVEKSEEISNRKTDRYDEWIQLKNADAFVAIIQESQKLNAHQNDISANKPILPVTAGQVIIRNGETENIEKAALLTELAENFNQIDTNKDGFISSTEINSYIHKT